MTESISAGHFVEKIKFCRCDIKLQIKFWLEDTKYFPAGFWKIRSGEALQLLCHCSLFAVDSSYTVAGRIVNFKCYYSSSEAVTTIVCGSAGSIEVDFRRDISCLWGRGRLCPGGKQAAKGRNRKELPLPKHWASGGNEKKVCYHNDGRAPLTQGWQLQLVLQGLCSSFFCKDDKRGMGFVLTDIIFFNTRFHSTRLLYWDAPGHILGPLPFFTLYPPGPLQPPCFYLTTTMPMKFTFRT